MAQFIDLSLLVGQHLFQLLDLGSQVCGSQVCGSEVGRREWQKAAHHASDQRDGVWFAVGSCHFSSIRS
jgi:hypothetical protein